MPIAPTLILGLGGTGSKIVERVQKMVAESDNGQSGRISYVVFDTDINDLGSIKQDSPEIYTVQTSTSNTVGEYLGINTNARDHWFPVNEQMNRKSLTEGAAQVRAISRLAFDTTLKSGNLQPLHEAVESLFRINKDQEEQSLRVIITSSLAGGTGSGILLSVAMYLTNFLKAAYPKAKAITRGFFIQPDVFYKVIPGSEEQQNLKVNAYAAVRELDAFLMKGDNTLPPQYEDLQFEFPRIGADGVEVVNGMPYDFCFLFDAKNNGSGGLDSFASYLDHAATCIYTQSIGPMSKKSNSREDNVLREVIKNDGRNRYAGAGASRLVYPWQHVRDYTGWRWADEALSKEWMQFDKQFRERQIALAKQRENGFSGKDLDRASEFIGAVEAAAGKNNGFAKAIQNQCLVFDSDGLSVNANQWEEYVDALSAHIADGASRISDAGERGQLGRTVAQLAESTDGQEYADAFGKLERYMKLEARKAEEQAGIEGYSLFKADSDSVTKDREPHQLETYLRDPNSGNFVHPVSARYFLYQTLKSLQDEQADQRDRLRDVREYFDKFEQHNFDDQSTEEIETASSYAMRKKTLGERITRKPSEEKQELAQNLSNYLPKVQTLCGLIMAEAVLEDAIAYVTGIIDAFETFFISLEGNLKRLHSKVEQARIKFDDLTGTTTRFVLASSECIDSLSSSMVYSGGVTSVDSELSEAIYNKVRDYHMLTDEKSEGFFKDLYNNTMLKYFTDQVMRKHGEQIKMDIIEALEREYTITAKNFEQENVRHYVKTEIDKAKRLASPFIEQPLGEERHPITACAYNPVIEGDSDPKRKSLVSELLQNYGGERDNEISPQEILFYNAIYGIRARDLGKFAPPRESATEKRNAGEYYQAYYNLVSGIKPSVGETKVITPHIDRRWHSISELPDLDETSQAMQLRRINDSLITGLAFGLITRGSAGAGKAYTYRYKPARGLPEDFVVSNGTPCDEFYEVADALTINPVAVDEILTEVEKRQAKERQRLIGSYWETEFGGVLRAGFSLAQLNESQEARRAQVTFDSVSIFGVAAYVALSTPADEYIKELTYAMSRDVIDFVHRDISAVVNEEQVEGTVDEVLQQQLAIFVNNLTAFYKIGGEPFMSKLEHILLPLEEFAGDHDLATLVAQTRAALNEVRLAGSKSGD